MLAPRIDPPKCTGCGLCVSVCTKNGLVITDMVVVFVGGDECNWCGLCEAVCATGAISCPFDILVEDN